MAPADESKRVLPLTKDETEVIEAYRCAKSMSFSQIDISILNGQRIKLKVTREPSDSKK